LLVVFKNENHLYLQICTHIGKHFNKENTSRSIKKHAKTGAKQTVARQVCFFPIQGLIHHGNIATVTKQRAFNKTMITSFTEVIFIDEASESTLDIADWKVLMQRQIHNFVSKFTI